MLQNTPQTNQASFDSPILTVTRELRSLGFYQPVDNAGAAVELPQPRHISLGDTPSTSATGTVGVTLSDIEGSVSWCSRIGATLTSDLADLALPNERFGALEADDAAEKRFVENLSRNALRSLFETYTRAVARATLPTKADGIAALTAELSFDDIAELGDSSTAEQMDGTPAAWRNEELLLLENVAHETFSRAGRMIGKVAAAGLHAEPTRGGPVRITIDADLCRASFACREAVRAEIASELYELGRRGEVTFVGVA